MTTSKRVTALWLTLIALCLCAAWSMPARADAAERLTAHTDLGEITRHGNVCLVTDHRIVLQDLEAVGIEPGDIVRVSFLDQTLEMPVGFNFSEASAGARLLRIKEDAVTLATNMGEFASETIADKSVAADGTVTWSYKEGIEGPVEFTVELIRKGDNRGEGAPVLMLYTNVRTDYPYLSDEAFANFRAVTAAGIGEGALYRTSSPIDPRIGRNTYADAALRNAGVRTVMNLVDSRSIAEDYEGYGDSYYATTEYVALAMRMSFGTEESNGKLAEGLRFFASHEGPYAVHCLEGKDRTGVVVALLECFMGASYEEVRSDYMETFNNYYGVLPGDAAYDEIAQNNIVVTLRKLLETDDLGSADLAQAAENYFRKIGLKDDEIEHLRTNLGKSYPA